MLKNRTHQLGIGADFLQLLIHAILQFFTFLQRPSGYARKLGVTPYQLIRIQVWRIAGQEMQRLTPFRAGHIFLNHRLLVSVQAINHKMQCFVAAQGWLYRGGDAKLYDRARALFPADVLVWVQETQPMAWTALGKNHRAGDERCCWIGCASFWMIEARWTCWCT